MHPERLLDRFRVDAVHGGALGVLRAVTDAHTGRRYAVKSVRPEYRDDAAVLGRFLEEATTWIALGRHTHLVHAFWLVEDPLGPYLFLEYVDGRDLAVVLRGGRLPVRRAVDLAMQCASGLAYAHTKRLNGGVGVVHRDLKPSNLLVAADDHLKVTDFGLARVLRPEGGAPDEEPRGGTPAYMAPEQLKGAAADGRADVFSFGLVLHEMLEGKNPLEAATFADQARRTLEEEPPPLTDAPEALGALVARCVAKKPQDRPHDFREVLAQLAAIARELDHPWHVDPRGVEAPTGPSALVVEGPVLRPRLPRAGEPFAAEIQVRGDAGAGPVSLKWRFPEVPGLAVLDPGGEVSLRAAAGGGVSLNLRTNLLAEDEGRYSVPHGSLVVRGPERETSLPVKGFDAEVAFAYLLPLVGRGRERAALEELVRRRTGGLILFGPIGSGKSRLLSEGARLAAEAGVRPVPGRAQASGLRPMRILNEVARALLGETGGVRAAVNSLLGHVPATARYFAEVLEDDGAVLEQETPPAHHWFELLRAAAGREPLALLLDDLHHADEVAIEIVFETIARARAAALPVFVVATATTGEHEATKERRLDILRQACERFSVGCTGLGPLPPADVGRLVDAAFPGHGFEADAPWLLETIMGATGGNPFHATEILRALRELAVRRNGEWRLPSTLTPETLADLVPRAFDEAVRRRVAGLSEETRAILELAALAGEEFDASVLREAAGDARRVEAALGEMEAKGVIRPSGPVDRERYRFWNATAAPVVQRALQEQAPGRARDRHAAVARGLMAVYPDRSRALAIAHHLRAAGDGPASLPFTLAGCQRLLGMQLDDRARRLLANAEPLAEAAGTKRELRAQFDYLFGVACQSTGDYDDGLRALTRFIEAGAPVPGDRRALPRAHVRIGRIRQARGEYDRARESFAEARRILEEMGDLRTAAFVQNSRSELALQRGHLGDAEEHLAEAERLAAETGNEAAGIQSAILRGELSFALDDLGAAARAFRDAENRAQFLGDRRRRAAALAGAGKVALAQGYLTEAREKLLQAVELRAWMGDRAGVARGLVHIGDVDRASGRADRALRNYRRALRVFEEIGLPEGVAEAELSAARVLRGWGKTTAAVRRMAAAEEGYRRLGLPERYRALRDLAEALADAGSERAARIALARADRGARARGARVWSRVLRSRMDLRAERVDRALARARRAVRQAARATGHGARIVSHLALAESSLATGDAAGARRSAETALAFAQAEGRSLDAAVAERVLMELALRAGRPDEAAARAHRAARAYTGRADAADAPARLLLSYGRGLAKSAPERSRRYLRAARHCYGRLEAQGFRAPPIP